MRTCGCGQALEEQLAAKDAELAHVRADLASIAAAAGEAEGALEALQAKHAANEQVGPLGRPLCEPVPLGYPAIVCIGAGWPGIARGRGGGSHSSLVRAPC
jgi:hypothetical protein